MRRFAHVGPEELTLIHPCVTSSETFIVIGRVNNVMEESSSRVAEISGKGLRCAGSQKIDSNDIAGVSARDFTCDGIGGS